jgi:hypothetical protein
MARKSSTAPPAIRAPQAAKSPRPKGSSTTAALLAVGERCPGRSRQRVSRDALRPGHADRCCLCGGLSLLARWPGRSSAIAVSSRLCPGLLSAMPLRLPANPQPRKVTAFCCSSPDTYQANSSPCQSAARSARRPGWDSWKPRPRISGLPDAAQRRGLRHSRARRLPRTTAAGNPAGEDGVVRALGHRQITAQGQAGG